MTIVVDWDVKQNSNKHVSPCCTDPSKKIVFAGFEPEHNKDFKITCIPSKDSDQPVQPHSLVVSHC